MHTVYTPFITADGIYQLKSDKACTPKDYANLPMNFEVSLTYSGNGRTGHWKCVIKEEALTQPH